MVAEVPAVLVQNADQGATGADHLAHGAAKILEQPLGVVLRPEAEAQLDQGAEVEVSCRFREFVGDHGSDGISGRKKRRSDLRSVADDHRNRHGFAQGPRQSQKD